jgi:3'-phosphoadenosine 5'-phosphosulfate sulfotransferase (PAPS reductase)/FAD synthetase
MPKRILAFSGGKDSTACGFLLAAQGVRFEVLFTPTGNELPEVRAHVERMAGRWGTKREIDRMALEEPAYLARALEIEDPARSTGELRTVKGLGRTHFAWRDYLEGRAPEACAADEVACGCYDGTEE